MNSRIQKGGLYQGEIDRLIIFAAPSGSGKTTFLKKPEARMNAADLPSQIPNFFELAKMHKDIVPLKNVSEPRFENLCLHVDLTQPFRWSSNAPRNRKELLTSITPQLYSNWEELVSYSERAKELHIVTFFVRREENFRRWIGRRLNLYPNTRFVKGAIATVNGDTTNNSELHRKVYKAWQDFVAGIPTLSTHVLDGNGLKYTFIPQDDYESEIDKGYRS